MRAGDDADKQRAEDAGAAMKRRHAGSESNEERQGVDREREDQPAEQADANMLRRSPMASMVVASVAKV